MMEIAKWLVTLVAAFNFGGLFVDGPLPVTARTHLYNPRWPPHAKFHNCQTMLLGVGPGTTVLVLLLAVKAAKLSAARPRRSGWRHVLRLDALC